MSEHKERLMQFVQRCWAIATQRRVVCDVGLAAQVLEKDNLVESIRNLTCSVDYFINPLFPRLNIRAPIIHEISINMEKRKAMEHWLSPGSTKILAVYKIDTLYCDCKIK